MPRYFTLHLGALGREVPAIYHDAPPRLTGGRDETGATVTYGPREIPAALESRSLDQLHRLAVADRARQAAQPTTNPKEQ